jgi:hypothetical protein
VNGARGSIAEGGVLTRVRCTLFVAEANGHRRLSLFLVAVAAFRRASRARKPWYIEGKEWSAFLVAYADDVNYDVESTIDPAFLRTI